MLKLPFATRAPRLLGYDDSIVETATILASLDTRHRIAGEMLIAGVAFQRDTTTWAVFSHDGDELGTLSTHVVETMRRHFKRYGYRPARITNIHGGEQDSVTYGFGAVMSSQLMERLMERHRRNPKTIH
jgi:hypothetical protein